MTSMQILGQADQDTPRIQRPCYRCRVGYSTCDSGREDDMAAAADADVETKKSVQLQGPLNRTREMQALTPFKRSATFNSVSSLHMPIEELNKMPRVKPKKVQMVLFHIAHHIIYVTDERSWFHKKKYAAKVYYKATTFPICNSNLSRYLSMCQLTENEDLSFHKG